MIKKQVTIDGKEYTLGMSALLPKIYRAQYGRALVTDMRKLTSMFQGQEADTRDSVLEDIVWATLNHGGTEVGDSQDEWLASIDSPFAMYELLPTIVGMWTENNKTTAIPRKK